MGVLMNVVAAELKVADLAVIGDLFGSLDVQGTGRLPPSKLQEALISLGVSTQHTQEVMSELSASFAGNRGTRAQEEIAYGPFIVGCMDLVDDKLDHMLWKVFAMVDEDHAGEMHSIVLEHFLQSSIDRAESGAVDGEASAGVQTDVERYLCSVLNVSTGGFGASALVAKLSGGTDVVTFEEMKNF